MNRILSLQKLQGIQTAVVGAGSCSSSHDHCCNTA
jgi:hypothetical protein